MVSLLPYSRRAHDASVMLTTTGTCAVSGLAILGPYLSRACGVCGLKCLFASEMKGIAGELLGPDLEEVEISAEVCSGCGGKFMV